jgi:hypothetical protein
MSRERQDGRPRARSQRCVRKHKRDDLQVDQNLLGSRRQIVSLSVEVDGETICILGKGQERDRKGKGYGRKSHFIQLARTRR